MIYLTKFNTYTQYVGFTNTEDYILPNVSLCLDKPIESSLRVNYTPVPLYCHVGDIIYGSTGNFGACSPANWSPSLGNPQGVCVIPPGVLPDKLGRMVGLNWIGYDGKALEDFEAICFMWAIDPIEGLPDYFGWQPGCTNTTMEPETTPEYGFSMPSDMYSGPVCFQNPDLKYESASPTYGMSVPILLQDETLNPCAVVEIAPDNETHNISADLDGAANRQIFVNVGYGDVKGAVYAASLHSTPGVPVGEWYIPAGGELCALFNYANRIDNALSVVGGSSVKNPMWRSTPTTATDYDGWAYANMLYWTYGAITNVLQENEFFCGARPFAKFA